MGITVYIDDWHKQPSKVVRVDVTDGLDEDHHKFWGHEKGEDGRFYRVETVYANPFPTMDFSDGHWGVFSRAFGLVSEDGIGSASYEELSSLVRRVVRFLNVEREQVSASSQTVVNGNFMSFGASPAYLKGRAGEFADLIKFAIDRGKGIYWG